MSELKELNEKLYDFVQHWHDGVTLEMSGVSLPDCIEYDVLSVVGRQLVNAPAAPEAEAQP